MNINYTKLSRFEQLPWWSMSECVQLMEWHVDNKNKKIGINQNLSLLNFGIAANQISWSMLIVRSKLFTPSHIVIMTFSATPDARMMTRMETTFSSIRRDSRWYTCLNGEEILGDERINLTTNLITRIITSFGWSGRCNNYNIRRYRLNWILSSFGNAIDRTIDCHHKSTLKSILGVTDDRFMNLSVMPRFAHSALHISSGDYDWIDM